MLICEIDFPYIIIEINLSLLITLFIWGAMVALMNDGKYTYRGTLIFVTLLVHKLGIIS